MPDDSKPSARPTKASPISTSPIVSAKPAPARAQGDAEQPTSWLEIIRRSFEAILGEINYELDQDYGRELQALRLEVQRASSQGALLALGDPLHSLVRRFAVLVLGERTQSTSFVFEVVQRLVEVEEHLRSSVAHTVEIHRAGEQLSDSMSVQIKDLGENVQASHDLAQVKGLVMNRLDGLTQLVAGFRSQERGHLQAMTREMEQLRGNFRAVKEKLHSVEKENQSLACRLRIDPLTGAHNRMAIEERLAEEQSRLERYGREFSVLMIDLDHFKLVNDNFGHAIGDKCLKELVVRLQARVRASDMVGRYGGEEFVVILPETAAKEAGEVAEKLRITVEEIEFLVRGSKLPITISVGVTQATPKDADIRDILDRADRALYQAKDAGRNRVMVAAPQ